MIRPISLSYCGMTIAGTVESPDARPARYFTHDLDGRVLMIEAVGTGFEFLYPSSWREIAPEPELIDETRGA